MDRIGPPSSRPVKFNFARRRPHPEEPRESVASRRMAKGGQAGLGVFQPNPAHAMWSMRPVTAPSIRAAISPSACAPVVDRSARSRGLDHRLLIGTRYRRYQQMEPRHRDNTLQRYPSQRWVASLLKTGSLRYTKTYHSSSRGRACRGGNPCRRAQGGHRHPRSVEYRHSGTGGAVASWAGVSEWAGRASAWAAGRHAPRAWVDQKG
jgi:hypothetical protein